MQFPDDYPEWLAGNEIAYVKNKGLTSDNLISLSKLSHSASNDVGWRAVTVGTVLEKVLSFSRSKSWGTEMKLRDLSLKDFESFNCRSFCDSKS